VVGEAAMPEQTVFVFDAYGTLFDVHAAIGRYRAAAGSDADHFSNIWRTKQLEYAWTLTLAGDYVDFWTLTERAIDFAPGCQVSIAHYGRNYSTRIWR
jgi:HAD superfamily hydrolase (TIGR01493 family)